MTDITKLTKTNIQKDSPEEILKWLSPDFKEILFKHFNIETIKRAIAKTDISISRLTEEYKTENNEPSYYHKYELIKDYHTDYVTRRMVRLGKQWECTEQARVRTYRIPSQYANLQHGKIIEQLLNDRFDWFKKFKWEIYSPNSSAYIFLKNSKGKSSIYLDLDTLFSFSEERITVFNWKFHKHYYEEPAKNEFYEHNKNACKINQKTIDGMFKTHIAKKFFNVLKKENR